MDVPGGGGLQRCYEVAPSRDAGLTDGGLTDARPVDAGEPETVCDDGLDNDGDGLPDCADPDCADATVCPSLTWIQITGGTFQMGSEAGQSDEKPVHEVTVASFEMTRSEVTVVQYGWCVSTGLCTAPDTGGVCNWGAPGRGDHPVNCLSWTNAAAFCAWAGGRLPSEAEWEYAARSGGHAIEYPWGNTPASCQLAVMNDGEGIGCGTDHTMSVCSKPAGNSAQGLCDMAGNVYEWVQDWYHNSYTGAPTDGSAWETPVGSDRVWRGGGLYNDATYQRAAGRFHYDPTQREPFIGVRCARVAP